MGLSLAKACRHVGISRQAYYKQVWAEGACRERDERVVAMVQETRRRQPRLGTRKLHYLLREPLAAAGIKLGRDALFRTLKRAHLLVPPRRAFHKTTQSFHRFYKHPNLLTPGAPEAVPNRPEQVWVADITYLPTQGKYVYLSLVTDAYSRKIVGHHVHASLQTEDVAQALKMALKTRRDRGRLVHHSDRGIQYCSAYYQALHTPPRQNSCRPDMISNLGAIRMKDGSVRRTIQEQSGGAVVAAGERQCWLGVKRDRRFGANIGAVA